MRDGLATRFLGFQVQRGPGSREAPGTHREASVSLTLGDDNTLISPVTLFEMPEDHKGPPKISILGFTIVQLDPVVIRDTVLAALTNRHFHGNDAEVDYRVVVVKKDDPQTVIWESEPGIAAMVTASPDVTQGFMGPRPDQMFVFARNLRDGVIPPPPPPPPQPGSQAAPGDPGAGIAGIATAPADRIAIRADNNIVVSMIEKETGGRGGPGGACHHPRRTVPRLRHPLGVDGEASIGLARGRGRRRAPAQSVGQLEHPDAADGRHRIDRRVGAPGAGARAAADGICRGGLA